MSLMLDHVDSPYIRCIGFLYLRYAADPSTLWSWFEPYLYDEESVQIRQGQADTTVGEFVRMLLENLEYYGTRLPRLPLALERQFKVKLLQAERTEERAKLHEQNKAAMEYFQKLGSRIQALYGDAENPVTWYDAVVDRVILRDEESGELLSRPKFQVTFPEYGNTEIVSLGEVDLPGTHAAGAEAVGEGKSEPGGGGYSRNDPGCGRGYDDYNRDRDWRGRGYGDDFRRGRDDRYAANRRRDYDGDRFRDGHRGSDYRRDDPRRERSRSRDREKSREEEERELLEEVKRREREKSAAKGKAYAARPSGFRGVNADDSVGGKHDIQDKRAPPPKAKREESAASPPRPAPVVKKSAADLAAIEEKKRKLMAKYG
jgi:pre-mRNA-splicing factor 38B